MDELHTLQIGRRLSTVVGPPRDSATICPQSWLKRVMMLVLQQTQGPLRSLFVKYFPQTASRSDLEIFALVLTGGGGSGFRFGVEFGAAIGWEVASSCSYIGKYALSSVEVAVARRFAVLVERAPHAAPSRHIDPNTDTTPPAVSQNLLGTRYHTFFLLSQ